MIMYATLTRSSRRRNPVRPRSDLAGLVALVQSRDGVNGYE